MNRNILFIGSSFVFIALISCVEPLLFAQTKVPFVGCKADGQVGPLEAPKGKDKAVHMAPEVAQQLAYYKAGYGDGVLAPRSWYCFETYGSNGSSLYVSSQPINAASLFSDSWEGFTGPVIQISNLVGDTSGRFRVAQIIARVFPSHKAFVRRVIAEGIKPADSFPYGSYPKDKLTYKGKELVEFLTPSETDGLGTSSRLKKNSDPISGVAILVGQTPDLVHLSVRLPKELRELAPTITHQLECDAASQH